MAFRSFRSADPTSSRLASRGSPRSPKISEKVKWYLAFLEQLGTLTKHGAGVYGREMDPENTSATDGFDDYLRHQGLAPKTITIYLGQINRFVVLANQHGIDPVSATATEIVFLVAQYPNTTAARRQLHTTMKHFWEYHERPNPPLKAIRVPRSPRGKFNGLEHEQAEMIANTAKGWHPQGTAVLCGLYLALRREEIAQLRWDRFDRDLSWYTVHGKGNVYADLPVHPVLAGQLEPTAYKWAFPGRMVEHVTPATIWNWVREVSTTAGIGLIHPHQLRHTAIATINDTTKDLRTAQAFARHARPETTAIYTRTTSARLLAASASLDFLG